MARAKRTPQLSALTALLVCLVPGAGLRADTLPPPLKAWISCEQGRMSRAVDHSRLMALTNHQDQRFAPETGATFPIKSYWVNADKMRTFKGLGLAPELQSVMLRQHQGKRQVRLIVHPESEGLYANFLKGAQPASSLMATATASSRTLLVWPRGKPAGAFFAKVSLDKEIGGVRRTISGGEVARSVGINNVLQLAGKRRELPSSFGFIPEVLSAIPRGMSEGGMVIRAIPKALMRGDVRYVPLFSLYAKPKNGGQPLLQEMVAKSGMPMKQFVRDKIIRPFAKQWLKLSVQQGIVPEPHAQNVLLELGRDGLPTGRFIHRDFGGFNVDFAHRKSTGKAMPSKMPTITTLKQDYKVDRYGTPGKQIGRNLDSFFYGGFVYNLDSQVPKWRGAGVREGAFKKMLTRELEQQFRAMTGKKVRLGRNLRNVSRMVEPLRASSRPRPPGDTLRQPRTGLGRWLGRVFGRRPARSAGR